jgi:hypothetical protein
MMAAADKVVNAFVNVSKALRVALKQVTDSFTNVLPTVIVMMVDLAAGDHLDFFGCQFASNIRRNVRHYSLLSLLIANYLSSADWPPQPGVGILDLSDISCQDCIKLTLTLSCRSDLSERGIFRIYVCRFDRQNTGQIDVTSFSASRPGNVKPAIGRSNKCRLLQRTRHAGARSRLAPRLKILTAPKPFDNNRVLSLGCSFGARRASALDLPGIMASMLSCV